MGGGGPAIDVKSITDGLADGFKDVLHPLDEGLGEITGRNAQRKALNLAQDQFDQANKNMQNQIAQQRWNTMTSDVNASSTAKAIRATAASTSGVNYNNSTPLGTGSGALQKDFLGV